MDKTFQQDVKHFMDTTLIEFITESEVQFHGEDRAELTLLLDSGYTVVLYLVPSPEESSHFPVSFDVGASYTLKGHGYGMWCAIAHHAIAELKELKGE